MTQISRNPVHKDVYYSIRDDLVWVFSELHSQEDTKVFFYEFFTKTERIMLAKRLAVAMMLHRGFIYRDIRDILHVSTSTITGIATRLDQGGIGLKKIFDKLAREERMEVFWTKVNRALDRFSRLRK